jgi:hypothetical protein
MDPDRWARVKRVFQAALECEPGRRSQFVREACAGDVSLQETVEAMLAREPEARGFLESPAVRVESESPGSRSRCGVYACCRQGYSRASSSGNSQTC